MTAAIVCCSERRGADPHSAASSDPWLPEEPPAESFLQTSDPEDEDSDDMEREASARFAKAPAESARRLLAVVDFAGCPGRLEEMFGEL